MTTLTRTLGDLTEQYLALHSRKEDLFWETKMGLAPDPDKARKDFADAEIALQRFLHDASRLSALRALEHGPGSDAEKATLRGWIAFLSAHTIEDPKARALSEEIVEDEQALEQARGAMELGYIDPATGKKVRASSVKLGLMLRSEDSEALRRAAFEGLRSIEGFVLDKGFLEIVKKRNRLGRMLGYADYYDWRTSVVERMSKVDLFGKLENLEVLTRDRTHNALHIFAKDKGGDSSLLPWNFSYLRAGKITKELDPYFGFASALDRWGRSFTAMGVKFRGATLTLDLVDRAGKYENGFMHGPGPCFFDQGSWRPARINFTANAVPGVLGSGLRAAETLFHEGGHAAHFSNILKDAPCFSQEFAPTSVAYAETQSMFMDSLLGDADWRVRYATDAAGKPMPEALIEAAIVERQPFRAWDVRAMLTIPFAERALYEMPESELGPEKVLKVFREIEKKMQGLDSGVRPVLSVPHLLSGESSAYYHGYVLAEMAVEQTRQFFLRRDGFITDNPRVGPDLAHAYWSPGNSVSFDETLKALTGTGLSADALAADCNQTVEEAISDARQAIARSQSRPRFTADVALDATVRVIHGPEEICSTENGWEDAAARFSAWVTEAETHAKASR